MSTQVNKQAVHIQKIMFNLLKVIVFSYILTGALLLVLALIMYKLDLSDKHIRLGVMFIMILSTFAGGFLSAKAMRERRLIYGSIVGITYFLVLLIISLTMHQNVQLAQDSLSMFFVCLGSGALGGMLG